MLIFIPTTDYSRDAVQAASFHDLDLGPVAIRTTAAFSFRLGNVGTEPVAWTLAVNDPASAWTLPEGSTLAPGETTDTLTVQVSPHEESAERGYAVDLTANGATLVVEYEITGTNAARRTQYPRRAGDAAASAGAVIDALGDNLRVWIYDPVPWTPPQAYGQKFKFEYLGDASDKLAGYRPARVLNGSHPCDRLNPHDPNFGYARTETIIQGQFSRESRQTRYFGLTADNSQLEYQVSASLIFPAEYELPRVWALFEVATDLEPATYKRTVLIVQRQGEYLSVENIRSLDRGDMLSHFEADLVALHSRNMGKPTGWNPFAITYRLEEDIPYAYFTCSVDLASVEGNDSSGSNSSE